MSFLFGTSNQSVADIIDARVFDFRLQRNGYQKQIVKLNKEVKKLEGQVKKAAKLGDQAKVEIFSESVVRKRHKITEAEVMIQRLDGLVKKLEILAKQPRTLPTLPLSLIHI